MKRAVAALPLLAACSGAETELAPAPVSDPPPVSTSAGDGLAQWVDPFIGTADSDSPDPVGGGKGGSTFPGAALPFGLVQWSPDTTLAEPAGYNHASNEILGFSLTHLNGAGCSALRDFPVFASLEIPAPLSYPSATFAHENEHASPGFYEVLLDSGILVDLTATTRTGFARLTFPDAPTGYVTLSAATRADLPSTVGFEATVTGPDTLVGSRDGGGFCGSDSHYTLYFAARFDRSFDEHGGYADYSSGLYFGFDTRERRVVQMKIGLSFVSTDAALANLEAESPGWDFDAVHARALQAWESMLNRIRVTGGTDDERRMFYTALYHALLQPAAVSDVSGEHIGFDGHVERADGWTRYANFSGWDVYRSWIQLVAMIAPEQASHFVRSLLASAGECGALPKWSLANDETGVMVGDPAAPTIASAHAFGARDFDAQAALDAMIATATVPDAACNGKRARPGNRDYLERHYCPIDGSDGFVWGPAATTLEYAIADFSIARLASELGDATNASAFYERSRYWQNVFDAGYTANGFTGYVQPRLRDDLAGQPQFDNYDVADGSGFVEGNSAQYTFMVPHDLGGLVSALGGDELTVARLDALFTELNAGMTRPYFYMGNEPQFGTPWLYAAAGAPHRTQAIVRRITREVFSAAPNGLPGNDDLGATSSWLVWAMLGLYPLIPGVGGFVVGSPLFPEVIIELPSGKTIAIRAPAAAADAPYVQSLSVNGVATTSTWLAWQDLANGATLDFELSAVPGSWGSAPVDRPPSFQP